MANLNKVEAVEIFSAGYWNGDEYTIEHLDQMVHAFNENKAQFRPYLKLGHDKEQKLLQEDGLPAAGWIGNIYRMGEKLMADFVDIPEKIFQLLKNKAYRKVSSEIYWDLSIKGTVYPRMLSAVALLGADTPAVMNLNDILAMYGLKDASQIKIYADESESATFKTHDFVPQENRETLMPTPQKTEAEMKLELELKAEQEKREVADAQLKQFAADKAAQATEIEQLKADKAKSDKAAADAILAQAETEREAFITELTAKRLITPAMKPYMKALLGESQKEYSIGEKDKEKKFSKFGLIEQVLKLHAAADVNTDEQTEDGEQTTGNSDEKINAEIEKYMDENKCSYSAAYKAVAKVHTPRKSASVVEEE